MDILDIADTPQELKQKETEWIEWYMRQGIPMYNTSNHGYWGLYKDELSGDALSKYIENCRKGGDGSRFGDCKGKNNGNYGHHLSTASKRKMSRAIKGRVQSEEERKMRSKAHNHNFNPPNHKGKRVMHLGNTWTFVNLDDIESYLANGWKFGQGIIHINNGTTNKLVTEEQYSKMNQDEWKRGLLRGK